jgi:hypothetical protein
VYRAVLIEDKKRAAHRALEDRVLNGEGRASPELRAGAFSNAGLSPLLDGLADLESAPVEDGLRATLRMLGELTREGKVGAEDMRQVLSAGVSPQQVEDALAVCAAFNTTDRLADAWASRCSAPRASRQEPSTCSSGSRNKYEYG